MEEVTDSSGSGSGSGDGDGSGYGYGYSYGDGSGDGYGSGSGYGYGYGSGDGDGSGYGYGSGDGSGDGDGYWLAALASTVTQAARAAGAAIAFWRSGSDGRPCNGGSGEPVHVGLKEEIPGPLRLCRNALHGTLEPTKWEGKRLWIVALWGEVQTEGDKMGALKREILAEVP